MTVQNDIHRPHVLLHSVAAGKSKRCLMAPQRRFFRVVVQGCGPKISFASPACPCLALLLGGSGYGSGRSWSNRGSNGNYRSSSWYSSRNARYLNFNSNGVNPQNTNNSRSNGMAVRPVQHTILTFILYILILMTLTRQQLLLDIYQAFYSARRRKSRRSYVRVWERNLRENMEHLCDELYNRAYKPMPSKCFIVNYPKKREIFAAQFRDRIVHHLYYNYTHELFERTFIADSYSCIKGRGTHYGISRIRDFCRKESHNWQRQCYVLHLDIRGYFMHIDRRRLLTIATDTLRRMSTHCATRPVCCSSVAASPRYATWGDRLDMGFVLWLTEQIVMLNPKENCILCGSPADWDGLDPSKSMLHLPDGIGLPIGNLTSQLFSNIYLNVLDQYMKRILKCRYYGRYVDDAAVVSADRKWLLSLVPKVSKLMHDELGLELHRGKLAISEVHRGVEFLGVYIRHYRTYISRHAVRRMKQKIATTGQDKPWELIRAVNSYLGITRHASSYRLRRQLLMTQHILRNAVFSPDMKKATDRKIFYSPSKL